MRKKEQVQLGETWTRFSDALRSKDKETLRLLSFPKISCFSCTPFEQITDLSNFVPIDTFINQVFNRLNSTEWQIVVNTHDPALSLNDHSKWWAFRKNRKVISTLYEVLIQATPANPDTGYEGKQWVFQFVKQENEFKFWGLTFIG